MDSRAERLCGCLKRVATGCFLALVLHQGCLILTASDPSDYSLERLRSLVLRRWWRRTALLWITVGSLSLWTLRHELAALNQYFTWTALRYGLAYNRLAAIGLGLCVGLTVALLVGESRHILFGLSEAERNRLQKLQKQIDLKGKNHPLWEDLHGR